MNNIDVINESEKYIEDYMKHLKSTSQDTLEGLIYLYFYKGSVMRKHPELNDYLKNTFSIASFSNAINIAEKFNIKNDNYFSSLLFRAQCYKNINQYENAIRDYNICIKNGYKNLYLDRGDCYLALKQIKKALNDYKHIDTNKVEELLNDKKDNSFNTMLADYADIYQMIGNYKMADKCYNMSQCYTKSGIYWAKAEASKKIGNLKEAEINFQEAINVDPKHYIGYENKAEFYKRIGELKKAEKELSLAINNTDIDSSAHFRINYYEVKKDFRSLKKLYNELVESNFKYLRDRGDFYKEYKQYKEAEDDYLEYIKLLEKGLIQVDYEDANYISIEKYIVFNKLTELYTNLERYDEAEKYCKLMAEACSIAYNEYSIDGAYKYKKMGNLKMSEGNTILAKYHYEKYISNNLKMGIEKKLNALSELKENLCINCVDLLTITNMIEDSIPLYLKEYEHKSMIYVIRTNSVPKKYKEQIADIRKEYAMARINDNNSEYYNNINTEGVCLYVGSSHNIYKRLLEHLGFGAQKTFALHLKEWWEEKEPIQIEIYEVFNNKNDNLQTIEDILWSQNKPLFGRQGKR